METVEWELSRIDANTPRRTSGRIVTNGRENQSNENHSGRGCRPFSFGSNAQNPMPNIKTILVIAAISIAATFVFNRFIGPKIGVTA